MDFTINPKIFPKIATRMKIDVTVELGQRAYVRVAFYEEDIEFQPLETKMIVVEGEQYKAWGNDDQYIKDLVFKELGLFSEEKVMEEEVEQIIVDA